jgi:hypothetical protein
VQHPDPGRRHSRAPPAGAVVFEERAAVAEVEQAVRALREVEDLVVTLEVARREVLDRDAANSSRRRRSGRRRIAMTYGAPAVRSTAPTAARLSEMPQP